ncbi:MAG: OmpH family outer membrane protein [Proteobacteria bacterium]|nr:OmpH family outer membrane protein [Pseudomonadota bacterium]MCH8177798.1 OmpH family outer membrane protein [Pseudomonadota bacterium]
MNHLIRPLVMLILVLASSALVAETRPYKIGFVNTARVLKEAPQARRVEERLRAEFEPREAQIKDKRRELLAIEERLKSKDIAIDATARRKLERKIRLKVSQLKFLEQEFREDQNLRRNEGIRELQRVIAKVLEQLGDTGKFDLILTEGVSYVSGEIDITTQIVEMLKQQSETAEESTQ